MLKLHTLRLFVDQRLSAVTDDIFRHFAKTIAEYEHEVLRLRTETVRQQRLLETAGLPGTGAEEPAGVLQLFTTEEEQQVRGRGFTLHIKQEEGGASGPEDAETAPFPEAEFRPADSQQEAVKQEVDEGHMVLEAAVRAEISPQQEGVLQVFTTEEEQQVRGRGLSVHIKQEEGGASEPKSADWQLQSDDAERSPSSNQIRSDKEAKPVPAPSEPGGEREDSAVQSESSTEDSDDDQSEPGLHSAAGTGARTRARTGTGKRPRTGTGTKTWRGPQTGTGTGRWTRPPAEQNRLVCGSCGQEFSSRRTLTRHMRQNSAPDQDQPSCGLRLQRAPFQEPPKHFSCRICSTSFYTQGLLVHHASNHCKDPESRCGACGELLESTEALREHLRSHKERDSTCDLCGKKWSSMRKMEIHRRVHTGEKPYRCTVCALDFSRKESLERHLKIHTGERPHRCALCRKTFTRREYLVRHLNNVHADTQTDTPSGPE